MSNISNISSLYKGFTSVNTDFKSNIKTCIPGIHKEVRSVKITDFYPSIIRNYNICPTLDLTDEYLKGDFKKDGITIYDYKTGTNKVGKVVMSNESSVLPKIYSNLLDTLEYMRILDSKLKSDNGKKKSFDAIDKNRSNLKKEMNAIYGRLPLRLRELVVVISHMIISTIYNFIESKGCKVVCCDNDSIVWNGTNEISESDFRSLFPYSLNFTISDPFNLIIFSYNKMLALTDDGEDFPEFNSRMRYNCEFVRIVIKDIIDRIIKNLDYNQEDFLKDFHEVVCHTINHSYNSMFTMKSRIANYVNNTYFMNIYLKYLESIGIEFKEGDIIEYQVTKVESELKTISFGSRLRLPSDDNIIDFGYYINKLKFLFNMFNIKVWSINSCNPANILAKYKNELPTFENFKEAVNERIDGKVQRKKINSYPSEHETPKETVSKEIEYDIKNNSI